MTQISNLSLRCINYNKYLAATSDKGLILETAMSPTKKNALWTFTYLPLSWTLVNQVSSMYLTFDMQKKLITTSEDAGCTFNKSLTVKDSSRHLQFRLSLSVHTSDNQLTMELLAMDDSQGITIPIFFVCEGSNQIFRHIDCKFLNSSPTAKIITIPRDNSYDYVVIGSSFCSLAFIHCILETNVKAKILVLEKGMKYLPEHYQHCSPYSAPKEVEFKPWSISPKTTENEFVRNVHGTIPLLGGRSNYWSGWTPTPTATELAEWPEDLKNSLQEKYFNMAQEFLGVVTAENITAQENENLLYDRFQILLKKRLEDAANIESVEQILHAPLAMGNHRSIKFSTAKMLLRKENVTVKFNTTVEEILHDGLKATALRTDQGTILPLHNSKLILAMSTLPATTLVLNSFKTEEFPQLSNVGKRFTAHFVSSAVARVPRRSFPLSNNDPHVELGAVYIAGIHEGAQYHLQLSGVAYKQCKADSNIHQICKKYSANSIPNECIDKSEDFVVVSCSTLGELDYKNPSNQFNLMDNALCRCTNGELEFHLNHQDNQLWDWMDRVTFQTLSKMSISPDRNDLEYWHESNETWQKETPPLDQIRKTTLVHDASTMWIGSSEDVQAPVGPDYRLKGVDNVYITGGSLWPTGGSWNPVLTIVAMAMHLADTIYDGEH